MAVEAGSSPATKDGPPADAGVGAAAEAREKSAATEQSDPRALIKQMMGSETFQTTLLAGSFLIIKVLLATHGDVMTALAVVRASGVLAVIVGAILSALPIIAAVVLVVIFYGLGCGVWGKPAFKDPLKLSCGVIVLFACFLLTPWWLFMLSFVGLLGGLWDRRRRKQQAKRNNVERSPARIKFVPVLLLCLAIILPISKDLLFAMWLPREELHFKSAVEVTKGEPPTTLQVGYVLSDTEGWMSVLTSGDREVVTIERDIVESRNLCRKNYHESLAEVVYSTSGPPDCPE
jgi:hypothetical protein